jgi:hypothetical protein
MTKEFVVIDHEGQVSMGLKKDESFPESFATKAAADKRATELARCAPGETIYTMQMVAETVVPLGKPLTLTTKRFKTYTKVS